MYILNTRVDNLSKQEVLKKINELLASDEFGKQLVTTNPEFILTAQKDEKFKNIINHAWLSVADGYGIRLAAKYIQEIEKLKAPLSSRKLAGWLLNTTRNKEIKGVLNFLAGIKIGWWAVLGKDEKFDTIKEIVAGTDLVGEICRILSIVPVSSFVIPAEAGIQNQLPGSRVKHGMTKNKIFLLGGFGDTPRLVAEKFVKENENNFISYATFEEDGVIEKINNFAPSILFVAVNAPKAQKWIDENLKKMPSVKLAMGVGGAFDYISGKIKRAPESWRSKGLEWLYRLLHQPRRIKRIWQASVVFPWKVFKKTVI